MLKLRDEVQGLHICAGRVHESNIPRPRIANAVHGLSTGLVIVHVNGLDRRPKGSEPGSANENRRYLALSHDLQAGIIEANFHDEQTITQCGLHDAAQPSGSLVRGNQKQIKIMFAQELCQ